MSATSVKRWRRLLGREQDAAVVYRALAGQRSGEERDILLSLARAEERHADHWRGLLDGASPRPTGARATLLSWLARSMGSLLVLSLLQRAESDPTYEREEHAPDSMAADERVHALVVAGLAQRGRARVSGTLRATVFGMNDGLVSNLALVLGMAGTGSASRVILLAGLAGLLAGALSMAAGEYVSVRSQRELLETARPDLDARTVDALRGRDENELALVFLADGYDEQEAHSHAQALLERPVDEALVRSERDAEVVGSAAVAAASSFASFAVGATLPVLPFLVTTGTAAVVAATVVVGVALFTTGALTGVLTGGPLLRRGLRQLGIGAAAAAVSYALGTVAGVAV